MSTTSVAAARANAVAAKARMQTTFAETKVRLNPKTAASNAVAEMKEKTSRATEEGLRFAQERPGVVAGVGAGLLALLARKRIARLFGRSGRSDSANYKKAAGRNEGIEQ